MSPFYPELPSNNRYVNPLLAGVTGLGAGMEVGNQALKARMYGEALKEQEGKRRALEEYAQTGDEKGLYPYLTPEQAIQRPAQLSQQQLKTAGMAMEYWDAVKPYMTMDTYPKIREQAMQTFPELAKVNFPPPDTFKSKEDFNKWLFTKERMAADFKRLGMAPKMQGGYVYNPADGTITELPMTQYQQARLGQAETRIGQAQQRLEQPPKTKPVPSWKADQYETQEIGKIDDREAKAIEQYKKSESYLSSKVSPKEKQDAIQAIEDRYKTQRDRVKATADQMRGGAKAVPKKPLSQMTPEELREAIARIKGGTAAVAPATAAPAVEEDEGDEGD